VGDNPYADAAGTIDIESGTTIGVAPAVFAYLEGTTDADFYVVTTAFEEDDLGVSDSGYSFWEVRIPPGVGAIARFGGLELTSVCDTPGAAFSPVTTSGSIVSTIEPPARAPWLQPADLRMCILEYP
jgi:hypothetical protein